jgi:DNA-binding beta-propeller fold protein YncE
MALLALCGLLGACLMWPTFFRASQPAAPEEPVLEDQYLLTIANSNDTLRRVTLDTPWNINGNLIGQQSISLTGRGLSPDSVATSVDGSKVYICDRGEQRISQYTLSTPWNITTAVYSGKQIDASFYTVFNGPRGIHITRDGRYIYLVDSGGALIWSYFLATAWDISTADAPVARSINMSGEWTGYSALAIYVSPDGSRFYIGGSSASGAVVREYTTTTPFDVSELTGSGSSVLTTGITVDGVYFRQNGTSLYVVRTDGSGNTRGLRFALSSAWNLATATNSGELLTLGTDFTGLAMQDP